MTSGQNARATRSDETQRHGALRRFVRRRALESAYGAFFSTVFLMCTPAHSLAIDDIRVLSRLGQPLAAEIMVTPAAGEMLDSGCFRATRAAGDLPDTGRLQLALSNRLGAKVLRVTTTQPLREPMSEFVLQVKCPGVPTLIRNFLVMVDPPQAVAPVAPPAASIPGILEPVTASAGVRRAAAPSRVAGVRRAAAPSRVAGVIEPGSRYRVQSGDMLSTIAHRVAGRPDWSVWPIAQKIYSSNPGAFLLGDPNVITQGSIIYIPQLSEVDLTAATSQVRPPANISTAAATRPAASTSQVRPATNSSTTAATRPAAASPDVAAVKGSVFASEPETEPAAPATKRPSLTELSIADRVRNELNTPALADAPTVPLLTMQLTTSLLGESKVKMQLRAQGTPVPPAIRPEPVAQRPPEPGPQSEPEKPDNAINDSRAALQPDSGQQPAGGTNWLWVIVGLLGGALLGAVASAGLLRRNLRREYDHDVREGVQRHIQVDRMRRETEREQPQKTGDTLATAAVAAAPTMELPRVEQPPAGAGDYTVEVSAMPALDFEVDADLADTDTVSVKSASDSLDLELPGKGQTGQHEVDFELLERAYSEDYNYKDHDAETAADEDDGDNVVSGEKESFYHLENRDPADDTPLPIELGDDDMGDDDEDDEQKVVQFPR